MACDEAGVAPFGVLSSIFPQKNASHRHPRRRYYLSRYSVAVTSSGLVLF
jgi:hypothetical protein